mmetsp:Transcript_40779/g.104379  ORF Transcript_40779/g.104379 Transcript_40779/m.104379 type:complete len:363 (-) Transcript_40779:309-1397(-)
MVASGTEARRSHSLTVASKEVDMKWCGDVLLPARAVIHPLCDAKPRRFRLSPRPRGSQTRSTLSELPNTTAPSDSAATLCTALGAWSVETAPQVAESHTRTEWSHDPETRWVVSSQCTAVAHCEWPSREPHDSSVAPSAGASAPSPAAPRRRLPPFLADLTGPASSEAATTTSAPRHRRTTPSHPQLASCWAPGAAATHCTASVCPLKVATGWPKPPSAGRHSRSTLSFPALYSSCPEAAVDADAREVTPPGCARRAPLQEGSPSAPPRAQRRRRPSPLPVTASPSAVPATAVTQSSWGHCCLLVGGTTAGRYSIVRTLSAEMALLSSSWCSGVRTSSPSTRKSNGRGGSRESRWFTICDKP